MANVPLSEDVPKIYVPSLSVSHLSTPHLQTPHLATPGKSTYVKPERRHVKDLGDLLLGDPIKGTKQLRHTLKDAGYYRYLNVPVLNRLVGFSVMSKERFLDPISEGEWGVAFVNSLETLGGSLDIVANPVKALLPWAGGGSSTDLLKSMGWIEDEYRETYQWDTGNWLVDLLGEIISDPINWFTFGSSAAMKSSASAVDDVARAVIKEIPEEAVSTRTVVNLMDEFATHVGDDGSRVIENYITKQTDQLDDLYTQLNKANIPQRQRNKLLTRATALQDEVDEIHYLFGTFTPEQRVAFMTKRGLSINPAHADLINDYYRDLSFTQRAQLIQRLVDARQTKGYRAYNFWRSVNKTSKSIDELLTKAAIYTTLPFGLAKTIYEIGAKPLFKALWNKAIYAMQEADLFNKPTLSANEIRRIKTSLMHEIDAAFKYTVKDWDAFFKEHNYSLENARKLWISIYRSASEVATDINKINAQFIEEILKQVPELRYVEDAPKQLARRVLKDAMDPVVISSVKQGMSVKELTDYCEIAGTINYYIDEQAVGVVRDKMANDVKTFWATKQTGAKIIDKNLDYSALEPLDILYYIDEGLLKDYGGLSNLTNMLEQLSKTNTKEYQSYLALLNYVGVTLNNVNELSKKLNALKTLNPNTKEYKTLFKEIKTMLIQSKTGTLYTLDAVEHNAKFSKQVTTKLKKETNLVDEERIIQQLAYSTDGGWRYIEGEPASVDGVTHSIVTNTDNDYVINIKQVQGTLNSFVENVKYTNDTFDTIDVLFKDNDYVYSVDKVLDANKKKQVSFGKALKKYSSNTKRLKKSLEGKVIEDVDDLFDLHIEFIEDTQVLRDSVRKAIALGKSTDQFPPDVLNYLENMYNYLEQIKETGITDLSITDIKTICQTAYEEGTDVMFCKMSQENMLSFIGDMLNTKLKKSDLWKALSDPMSPLRKNLLEICEQLQRNEDTLVYVHNIKEILSTIDNVNLYNRLYTSSFCSFTDLPKDVHNYIQGEFFNRLYAMSDYKQPEFKKAAEEILSRFLDNLERQPDIMRMLREAYPDKATRDKVIQDITTTFKYKLNEYLNGLNNIKLNNNLDTIRLFKSFNNAGLVGRMRLLGLHYKQIVEHLIKDNPEILLTKQQALIDFDYFIKGISNKTTQALQINLEELLEKEITDLNAADTFLKNLDSKVYDMCNATIDTYLEEAFSEIAKINGKLQRRKNILGTADGQRVFNMLGYFYKNDLNQALRASTNTTNSYVYSTMGGTAFKTFTTKTELQEHKLAPVFFNKSAGKEDYVMFVSTWKEGYKHIENKVFTTTPKYISQLRSNLIDVYTQISTDAKFSRCVIPTNPRTYFESLTDKEILVWDYVTRKSSFNSKLAARYTDIKAHKLGDTDFKLKAESIMNPLVMVSSYQNTNTMVTSPEQLTNILEETDLQNLDIQVECIMADYLKNIKDLDTLVAYHDVIVDSINNDAKVVSHIGNLQPLVEDTTHIYKTIDLKLVDKKTKKQLANYFNTKKYGDIRMNDKRVLNLLKAELCWDQYENIKSMDAVQLRAYIDHNSSGEIFISNPNYDLNYDWSTRFNEEELQAAGLKVWQDPNAPSRFIIRRTDNNITNADFTFSVHESVFADQRQTCFEVIKQAQDYFYNDGMTLPYELYTGDMISGDAVSIIKRSDRYADAFGNLEEQYSYSNFNEIGHSNFFQNKMPRPNAMFIGDPNCYNEFMGTVADAYKSTDEVFIPKRLDLPSSVATGVVQATKMVNTQHKLLSLVANNDFYIGNEVFRPVFEQATDKEIKEFFEQNNFVACTVRYNKKGELRVHRVYVDSKASFKQAIDNKVLVLPYELYRNVVLGVNKKQADSALLNIYTRFIAGSYKSIWLSTPGFLMRNAIDSMLYKNMASTSGVAGLIDVIKYNYKAAKIIDWYDDIYKQAIKLREAAGGYATPNMQYVRKVLKQMPNEDKKMFFLMLAFEKSGGSAGLTETVEEAIIKYNKALAAGVDDIEESIIELLYKNSPIGWLNKANDQIERTARLGLLLNLMDNGLTRQDAFRTVIKTHFDYELAEAELGLLGQIFWFITFPIKNSLYYLDEGLTKNPDLLKAQMDAMEQSWNSGDITWDDVRHSEYLTYNVMSGHVRFKFNGKNIVLKTGSSVLDFFQVLFNPVDAAKDRLNPFLSVLLGLEDTSQLNPFSSMSNRIDQIRDGRSLIPSVYTTLYNRKYKKKHYIERAPYVRKAKWRPKRKTYIKKPSLSRYTSYKFMTNRYYFNKGKNLNFWLNQTNSIQPHWYMNSYRYRRHRNRYSLQKIK